jgi:hypothetical protein
VQEMFWVRWRQLLMIRRLLWRSDRLNTREVKFLRDIRVVLHRRAELTPKQRAWLEMLYDRHVGGR